MKLIRSALDYASERCGIKRLLLSDQLRTVPGEVLLERLGELINVGREGQQAMKEILESFLQRVDRDPSGAPLRLFPFTRPLDQVASHVAPREVLIDPKIGSGRPVLTKKAIRTATIADRFNSGESVESLARDYGLATQDIEEAIRYERPARIAA